MVYWKQGHKIQRGRYQIDRILGSGGAGVTYRAIDQLSGQLVAIKTLNAEMQARPDFQKHQERFIQEAFRLAKCSHPHIIHVNDVFQEGQLWCMAMEYVSGGTLSQYVQYKGILSEAEALKYIQQVGSALAYVHQQGFLHRDVKPGNIMLRKQTLEAVLIDFGLAREFVQDKVQVHTNSRTESFAPIEQYEVRAQRGAYTDVYALAATLYFILTQQLPFPAQFRQQGVNLVPPKHHNPRISEQINNAILKGMELLPQHRPQSIPEWLDLLGAGAITPVSVSPPPPTPVAVKPPQASPIKPPAKVARSYTFNQSYQTARCQGTPSQFQPTQTSAAKSSSTKIGTIIIPEEVSLLSAVGIDYTSLQELLSQGKWKEADQETTRIILTVTGREKSGWLDVVHIQEFPCEDLGTIDQLWIKYSNGQFGFSVQKKIYEKCGGTSKYNADVWRKFGDKVGWRKGNNWLSYKDLNFSPLAPQGHLPMLGMQLWGFKGWTAVIAARLQKCGFQ